MHGSQMKRFVCLSLTIYKVWEDLQKFYNENLLSRQNGMNHESYTLWKFGAIQYYIVIVMLNYCSESCLLAIHMM